MSKWTDMTADEKADHLKDELNRIIDFLNVVSVRVGKVAERMDQLEKQTA